MARAGLTASGVTRAALEIVDAEGPEALTLARVAAAAGVATPSLYKHVDGLPALRKAVALVALGELAERLAESVQGRSGGAALRALMLAYRSYATELPFRYQMIPQKLREDAELVAVADRVLAVILAALRGYDLPEGRLIHAARCVRVAAHGFATLESAGGFQLAQDLDGSFDALITMITDGVATLGEAA